MVWEKQRQGSENSLSYWPITSSLDHITLCNLQGLKSSLPTSVLNRSAPGEGAWPSAATALNLPTRLTAARWHWLTTTISRGHPHISFCNTHTFPINHVTASAYFHRYVLYRESLIDGSIKSQYATLALDSLRSQWVWLWCNGYRMNWTRRHEFKSWTRLIAFHIALIPLGKVWIQLFSLQLWVNSRTD